MELNIWRIFFDLIVFIAVVVAPSLYLRFMGEAATFKRGFFCDDPELRYPKKEESYTGKVIWTVSTIVPMGTILLHELFTYYRRKQLANSKLIKIFVADVYKKLLAYSFGLMSVNMVCNLFKYQIGRLRPHFFQECKPIDPNTGLLLSNCSNLADRYQYIENYVCSESMKNNARLSFFSGHSTLMSYQFTYFLLYTQKNMQLRIFGLSRPLIQTLNLILSAHLTISRIYDYYHHPSDLVFGAVVGITGALVTYHFLSDYTESYWAKKSQFLYSYEDESECVDSLEQVDGQDVEAQRKRKKIAGRDVVDKKKVRRTSDLVQADEQTALLSSNKSH